MRADHVLGSATQRAAGHPRVYREPPHAVPARTPVSGGGEGGGWGRGAGCRRAGESRVWGARHREGVGRGIGGLASQGRKGGGV